MGMGEKHGILMLLFSYELVAQSPHAGAGIDNDYLIIFCPDLQAGGISPVSQILLAGNGAGTSRAPEPNNHSLFLL